MRILLAALVAVASTSTVACSSSTEPPTSSSQDAGSQASDGGKVSDVTTSDGGTDSGASANLKAPTLDMLMPMTGGLHLMWTNNQADCDAIEGERKSDGEAYKVVFTVPDGSVDNHHDAPLTAGKTYTYRLRCKKGTAYSAYSNEKSGQP